MYPPPKKSVSVCLSLSLSLSLSHTHTHTHTHTYTHTHTHTHTLIHTNPRQWLNLDQKSQQLCSLKILLPVKTGIVITNKGICKSRHLILPFLTIAEANSIKNALKSIVPRNSILSQTQGGVISRLLTEMLPNTTAYLPSSIVIHVTCDYC